MNATVFLLHCISPAPWANDGRGSLRNEVRQTVATASGQPKVSRIQKLQHSRRPAKSAFDHPFPVPPGERERQHHTPQSASRCLYSQPDTLPQRPSPTLSLPGCTCTNAPLARSTLPPFNPALGCLLISTPERESLREFFFVALRARDTAPNSPTTLLLSRPVFLARCLEVVAGQKSRVGPAPARIFLALLLSNSFLSGYRRAGPSTTTPTLRYMPTKHDSRES